MNLQFANLNCRHCDKVTEQELVSRQMRSGAFHYQRWCLTCDNPASPYIPRKKLEQNAVIVGELRIIPNADMDRCARCGHRGAELHHWFPQSFDTNEAALWPKDYLCKVCHDKWHQLVTPDLGQKRKETI